MESRKKEERKRFLPLSGIGTEEGKGASSCSGTGEIRRLRWAMGSSIDYSERGNNAKNLVTYDIIGDFCPALKGETLQFLVMRGGKEKRRLHCSPMYVRMNLFL